MRLKNILLAMIGCLPAASFAQKAADSLAIRGFLEKVQQAYDKSGYLAFDIKYLYANKTTPGQYIDSVTGTMQMDKKRSRTVIDGLETVITDRYAIRVDNEEKLIYLGKPSLKSTADPVGMIEAILYSDKGMKASLQQENGGSALQVKFPPGGMYTTITIISDDKTGYLQQVKYELQTTDLVTEDMLEKPNSNGRYQSQGNVEVLFSNYKQNAFTDSVFNETQYFRREGRDYLPSLRFTDYRIFLASSNL